MNVKARVFGLPGKPVDPQRAAAWLKRLQEKKKAGASDTRDAALAATQRAEDLRSTVLLSEDSK